MAKKKTNEEYIIDVANKNPNIEVLEYYINDSTKIFHKCKICGYKWKVKPSNILQGKGCPVCKRVKRKTQNDYINELNLINPNIEVVGVYTNVDSKILHRCKICKYEWNTYPHNLLSGHGCPVCCNPPQAIGNPPEYKNSIWDSKYKPLAEYYGLTKDIMQTTMPTTNKKISVKCPSCGGIKNIAPSVLFNYGLGCKCSDGISFPEKFMMSLLEQLHINYKTQYSPKWIGNHRYDFYLPDYNCIIETNGLQHYNGGFASFCQNGRSVYDEQLNDDYKYKMAIKNGVINYIVIDCRKSELSWIKNNLMKSQLPNLLQFAENDIDWIQCNADAITCKIKEVANLWNNGLSICDIANKENISRVTVRNWLKQATTSHMCNYTKDEAYNRMGHKNKDRFSKQINQYDLQGNLIKTWNCLSQAQRELNISNISQCCRGQRKSAGGFVWRYVDDINQEDVAV